MDGISSRHRSARSSPFPRLVACITATAGGQRNLRTASPRRLLPSFCRTSWCFRDLVGKPAPGAADCGPRNSLQRLEPPDTHRRPSSEPDTVLAKDRSTGANASRTSNGRGRLPAVWQGCQGTYAMTSDGRPSGAWSTRASLRGSLWRSAATRRGASSTDITSCRRATTCAPRGSWLMRRRLLAAKRSRKRSSKAFEMKKGS